jgi:hypothetical protein
MSRYRCAKPSAHRFTALGQALGAAMLLAAISAPPALARSGPWLALPPEMGPGTASCLEGAGNYQCLVVRCGASGPELAFVYAGGEPSLDMRIDLNGWTAMLRFEVVERYAEHAATLSETPDLLERMKQSPTAILTDTETGKAFAFALNGARDHIEATERACVEQTREKEQ